MKSVIFSAIIFCLFVNSVQLAQAAVASSVNTRSPIVFLTVKNESKADIVLHKTSSERITIKSKNSGSMAVTPTATKLISRGNRPACEFTYQKHAANRIANALDLECGLSIEPRTSKTSTLIVTILDKATTSPKR